LDKVQNDGPTMRMGVKKPFLIERQHVFCLMETKVI
jgi:hypothetical protein